MTPNEVVGLKIIVAALTSSLAPRTKLRAVQAEAIATLWDRLFIKTKFLFRVNNWTEKLIQLSK
jgi:hypothetical protein